MKNDLNPPESKQLLTTAEATIYLDLKPQTLERWRPMRRGPKFIKIGSNVRYRRSDLDSYLDAGTVETKTE